MHVTILLILYRPSTAKYLVATYLGRSCHFIEGVSVPAEAKHFLWLLIDYKPFRLEALAGNIFNTFLMILSNQLLCIPKESDATRPCEVQ